MTDRTTKVTLTAQVANYLAGMDQAAKATGKIGEANAAAQRQLQATGRGFLAMGAVAAAGVALAVKAFADFDAEMSQVKTLSHATAGEMQKLTDAALSMGQSIGFSATEVAQAETELVKAGISVGDILGGSLKGALDLAAAGQIDVAQATQIAAEAMTQFGLKGKDVPHIADLLAAGADKALGSVGDLGQALESGGLVAAQFGLSIDETVGTLSAFAQAGLLGETAGTDLRQMLLKLANPSADAAKTMKDLGISLYDASGHFVGMSDLAGQLHDKMGSLDEATRNSALATIFGSRAIAGANVLYKNGAQGITDWTKKVNDSGFAAQQASGKMDNLKGDVSKLAAAFNVDLIKAGSGADGALRGLTKTATTLLEMFGKLPEPLQQSALTIGAVTAAVGLLGGAFLLGLPKIAQFSAALVLMSESTIPGVARAAGGLRAVLGGVTSFMTGPWGLAIGIGAAALSTVLVGGAVEAQQHIDDLTASLDANTGSFTKNTKSIVVNSLQKSGVFDAAKKVGLDPEDVTNAALGNTKAQGRVDDVLAKQTKKYQQNAGPGDAGGDMYAAAIKVAKAVGAQNDAVTASVKANAEAAEAAGTLTDAQGELKTAVAKATQAIGDNGATWDQTTQAGQANKTALDAVAEAQQGVIEATEKQTSSQEATTQAWQAGRDELYAVAAQMGLTGQAADDYVNNHLGKVPPVVSTDIRLTGAAEAEAAAIRVQQAIASIQRNIDVAVNLHGAGNLATTVGLRIANAEGSILDFYANGGIAGAAQGAVAKWFANGGLENHVAQIAPAGTTRIWNEPETGGEAYIPLAGSKRGRSLAIWQETGSRLGVQGFADGGFGPTYVSAPPAPIIVQAPAARSSLPSSIILRVGDREFTAYVDERATGVVKQADSRNARIVSAGRQRGGFGV